MKRKPILIALGVLVAGVIVFLVFDTNKVGAQTDSYRGVPVYYNGLLFWRSYGRNYAPDGYYLGQKWQCVEFIKRFHLEAMQHKMPEVMGHAKIFFDPSVADGQSNQPRGLLQFRNGGKAKPAVDDLVVFTDTRYGHVAIISAVGERELEVVQQNILGKPRQRFTLSQTDGNWFVGGDRQPAGWLRKP